MSSQLPDWASQAWARVCSDQARMDFLEALYFKEGRDDPAHPLHSLYTGLYMNYLGNVRCDGDAVLRGDVLADLCPSSVAV